MATFEQARAAFEAGDWQRALNACSELLAQDINAELPLLIQARALVHLNEMSAARASYARLLALDPVNFTALLEIGNVLRHLGERDQAGEFYMRACEARPTDRRGYLAAASLFEESAAFEQASVCLQRALTLATKTPLEAFHLALWMGRFRLNRGDAGRALEILRYAFLLLPSASTLTPDERFEFLIDFSEALLRLDLRQEAFPLLQQASQASRTQTLARLADLSCRFNLINEAIAVSLRNVRLNPDDTSAHHNLVVALSKGWRLDEAQAILDSAQARGLALEDQLSLRATLASRRGDVDQTMAIYQQMIANGQTDIAQSLAFTALCSDSMSPQAVTELHQRLFAPYGEGARTPESFGRSRSPERPLRIGLVSADFFGQHPISIFMLPLLKRLDRQRFFIAIYYTGQSFDQQTAMARSTADLWRELTNATQAQFATQIEADEIDILIDLSGHTNNSRTLEFAKRLAPAQAIFLGYPGSSGVPNIDWIIADPIVAPAGAEALFSEQIVRLPASVFCYAPEIDYPYPLFEDAVTQRPLTFGSFNTLPKLTPHTIRLWSAVLQAVPDARLLLKTLSFRDAGAVKRYRELFARQGIAVERIEFRGASALPAMMAEYAEIDIALDPVPYNGGTTTLQALWMGAPVITKAGGLYVSRMGASVMSAAGLADWVATDDAEYVAIAVRQASDRTGLLALKRGLRQRLLARPAWDADAYTRHFEAALQYIWQHTHL